MNSNQNTNNTMLFAPQEVGVPLLNLKINDTDIRIDKKGVHGIEKGKGATVNPKELLGATALVTTGVFLASEFLKHQTLRGVLTDWATHAWKFIDPIVKLIN